MGKKLSQLQKEDSSRTGEAMQPPRLAVVTATTPNVMNLGMNAKVTWTKGWVVDKDTRRKKKRRASQFHEAKNKQWPCGSCARSGDHDVALRVPYDFSSEKASPNTSEKSLEHQRESVGEFVRRMRCERRIANGKNRRSDFSRRGRGAHRAGNVHCSRARSSYASEHDRPSFSQRSNCVLCGIHPVQMASIPRRRRCMHSE